MKTRSKRCEAKNCLSSNVNLCLPDSVENIVQGIKILEKATGGSKVNPYSFLIKNNKDTHTHRKIGSFHVFYFINSKQLIVQSAYWKLINVFPPIAF